MKLMMMGGPKHGDLIETDSPYVLVPVFKYPAMLWEYEQPVETVRYTRHTYWHGVPFLPVAVLVAPDAQYWIGIKVHRQLELHYWPKLEPVPTCVDCGDQEDLRLYAGRVLCLPCYIPASYGTGVSTVDES